MSFADDALKPGSDFSQASEAMRLHNRPPQYDTACYDLAETFLGDWADASGIAQEMLPAGITAKLADEIQDFIEKFIKSELES